MPSKFDLDKPLARTDAEKRADRRFDAYFAFEMAPDDAFPPPPD